jgi:F-type H+-transporting ATPase subunit epsilon
MNLQILVPYRLFIEKTNVRRIQLETSAGSFGFLPARLDCVAALIPGIFAYEAEREGESYVAIDAGILVKTGRDVRVSVRHAIQGPDLAALKSSVEQEFLKRDIQEEDLRKIMAKMESGFIRRFAEFFHERETSK